MAQTNENISSDNAKTLIKEFIAEYFDRIGYEKVSLIIRVDLIERLNQLAEELPPGFKKWAVNKAVERFLNEFEEEYMTEWYEYAYSDDEEDGE